MKYLLSLLFVLVSCLQAQDADSANKTKNEDVVDLATVQDARVFPLQLQGWEALRNIRLMDMEKRPLSFTLNNISTSPVKISRCFVGCSCMELEKALKDELIQAKSSLLVKFTINGKKLHPGKDFSKGIFIELENNEKMGSIAIQGTNAAMWSFEPSQIQDIGTYYGFTTWKRSFRITSNFEDDSIKLLPPGKNKKFNYVFKQIGPKEYSLDIMPREPLNGNLRLTVPMKVSGVENYGTVDVSIIGKHKNINLHLQNNLHTLKKDKIPTDKPTQISTKISYSQSGRGFRLAPLEKKRYNEKVTAAYVEPEEARDMPLNSEKAWAFIAKSISTAQLPEGVTLNLTPLQNGIDASFTFPPAFFRENNRERTSLEIFNGKISIGYFTLKVD